MAKLSNDRDDYMVDSKLNICLLLQDEFDQKMPARPAITEIYGKYLPSLNHKVTWISPSCKGRQVFGKEKYNQVVVYTVSNPNSLTALSKLFNLSRYYFREYKILTQLLDEEKYDIIQVRNDVFSALVALLIKKRYNIPFVFQYSFPKEAFKAQKLEKRYSYYFGQFQIYLLKHVLKNADLIFPISKWMEAELIEEGISQSKMMPLPMGINPESFSSGKSDLEIKTKYALNDSNVLLYVGTMDKLRNLDLIIHSFAKILKHNPNTKLLMVGDGNGKPFLEKLSKKLGINNNVIFTGKVPYFDIPQFIDTADICLSPIPPLGIYKVSSPTKLFEYMAMRKPVVANEEIPEQKEVIEESDGGILTKFQPESFASAIIELLNDPAKAKRMGENGYSWAIENRSYESMALEVEKQYFKLLKSYDIE